MRFERWNEEHLRDVARNASRRFDFKKHSDAIFINTGDVFEGDFLHSNISDTKGLPGQAKKALHLGDILLTEIRPGNSRFAYVDFEPEKHVVSTKFMVIESTGKLHTRFLYHVLTNRAALNEFQRIAESRSGTFPQITFESIAHYPVPCPPRGEQLRIAKFLDEINEHITLLRETNKTLEAIAQAIFKSWFVDFDPVRAKMEGRQPDGMDEETAALFPDKFEESVLGLVPQGWSIQTIGDVIQTEGGGTPSTKNPEYWEPDVINWTSPRDLSGALSPILLDTERRISHAGLARISSGLLPVGTLLMSSRAPIGYLAMAQIPVAINQGYIAMPPGGHLPPLYMYFWCKLNMETVRNHANGSTFMEISKRSFRIIPIAVPCVSVVDCFFEMVHPLFDRIADNERQAQTLTALRDTLLPRLISGRLRLPEAEALATEACI